MRDLCDRCGRKLEVCDTLFFVPMNISMSYHYVCRDCNYVLTQEASPSQKRYQKRYEKRNGKQ